MSSFNLEDYNLKITNLSGTISFAKKRNVGSKNVGPKKLTIAQEKRRTELIEKMITLKAKIKNIKTLITNEKDKKKKNLLKKGYTTLATQHNKIVGELKKYDCTVSVPDSEFSQIYQTSF